MPVASLIVNVNLESRVSQNLAKDLAIAISHIVEKDPESTLVLIQSAELYYQNVAPCAWCQIQNIGAISMAQKHAICQSLAQSLSDYWHIDSHRLFISFSNPPPEDCWRIIDSIPSPAGGSH
jgi:phenylpyruvate tautomerase PptA (4-oxalocrotonate tautomerase family)